MGYVSVWSIGYLIAQVQRTCERTEYLSVCVYEYTEYMSTRSAWVHGVHEYMEYLSTRST